MSLKNPVTPPGIDPGTVRLVAQRLNHYATSGPTLPHIMGGGGEGRKVIVTVSVSTVSAFYKWIHYCVLALSILVLLA
jgi:hypothetical protein